jgi:hypothetical protein
MKTQDVILLFGNSIRAAAEGLKITPQAIYQWGEEVPELREYKIRKQFPDFDARVAALKPQRAAA